MNRQYERHPMKMAYDSRVLLLAVAGAIVLTASPALAGEASHYGPGVVNIRDFVVPEPGFYGALYNYFYTTNRLNDSKGNEIKSVTINPGPGPGVTVNVDTHVDIYAVAPTFIWVSPWTIAGARYAAYIAPSFSTSSLEAALATETGRGINVDTSSFGMGDLYVQPLWLGWPLAHWDFALAYGFYAPIGKYDTETVTFPGGGSTRVTSADNIGLGFWTHQFQGAVAWYPLVDRSVAVTAAVTYEINQEKEKFDVTPGQNLALNWGISEFLPLTKDGALLLELGPAGYDSWQTTDDTGSDASNPGVHDQVHAVGAQLGLSYAPWSASLNFHYFYEFAAEDRFQGQSLGLNFGMKF